MKNICRIEQILDKLQWYHSYKENGETGDSKNAKDEEAGIPPSKENRAVYTELSQCPAQDPIMSQCF